MEDPVGREPEVVVVVVGQGPGREGSDDGASVAVPVVADREVAASTAEDSGVPAHVAALPLCAGPPVAGK